MSDAIGVVLWGPLVLAAGLILRMRSRRAARLVALSLLALVFLGCCGVLVLLAFGSQTQRDALWPSTAPYADALAGGLLPILIGCPLATLLAAPRAHVDVEVASDTVLFAGTALGAMLTDGLPAFVVFWLLSLVPLARDLGRATDPTLRRSAMLFLGASTLPVLIGAAASTGWAAVAGIPWPFEPRSIAEAHVLGRNEGWIGALFWLGVAGRLGVFPLHGWVPVFSERLRSPIASMTVVSPFSLLLALRVCLPLSPPSAETAATVILPCAALSSAYGALLALGQDRAKRQLGFLWISVTGAAAAGLTSSDPGAFAGAVLHMLALLLSMTGLWLHVRAVSARTGSGDLRRLGGLVATAPGLATGFLLLGLATVSFPGTATFLSEDLVVRGLLSSHPVVAGVFLVTTALNGITLVRTFKRIFLGEAQGDLGRATTEDVLPRERVASIAILLALLVGGLVPMPLLLLKEGVKDAIGAGR
jgi:NADH-quinone oxidoreductase subunit M